MKDSRCPYDIIYEDNDLIVVYKKRDVFTVATNDKKTYTHNLYHYLKLYARKKNEGIFLVHRLDYETSGLLVFAKNEDTLKKLKNVFLEQKVVREYECVIREYPAIGSTFHIEQYLNTNEKNVTIVADPKKGKLSITDVTVTGRIRIGSTCRIRITTGRKNQIRLALCSLDFTLIGDSRYAHDEAKRMYLNAYHLEFPQECGLSQNKFCVSPLWICSND